MQTYENTISGSAVEAEAVVLVDSTGAPITSLPVTGPLTDTQLRATAVPVSDVSTTARTCASTIVSASGTVAAGKQSVQFVPSSDFTGTLLGAAWPGTNAAIGFSANGNDTLGAIVYTRTTGSITILTIT